MPRLVVFKNKIKIRYQRIILIGINLFFVILKSDI